MKIYFLFFLFCVSLLHAKQDDYVFGQGIQVGSLPLYIGGYFSVEYTDSKPDTRSIELDELALMLYGEKNHFSYMLELEAEDVYREVLGNESADSQQDEFHVERIFVNYEFDEKHAIKVGKFNSPIGFWNQNPINVLQATSSKPLLNTLLYPRFTTGLDLQYETLNNDFLHFDFMLQESEDFDKLFSNKNYNNYEINRHYGLGVSFDNSAVHYQLNAGYFEDVEGKNYSYLLAAFKYVQEQYTLQGEFGTQRSDGDNRLSFVGYLQGVYQVAEHHEAIVRLENIESNNDQLSDTFVVLGYTYRPYYPVAIKAEYQAHSLDEENKFIFSFSVLF